MIKKKSSSASLAVAFVAAILAVGSLTATATNIVYSVTKDDTSIAGPKGEQGETGPKGEDGLNGADGSTPFIGTNGNWWIGETDTGIKAEGKDGLNGEKGEKGPKGDTGRDGANGLTPYVGENGDWWIGEKDTGVRAVGKDGQKGDAGAKGDKGDQGEQGLQGEKGDKGDTGEDGQDGLTPFIGENGNWWIGTTDTGVKVAGTDGAKGDKGETGAQGEKGDKGDTGETGAKGEKGDKGDAGENGNDGLTPFIGENGNWWIGETDTGVKAAGTDGAQGERGEKGETGAKGDQGEQGIQGEKGDKGDTGEAGAKGDKGDKGDQGLQGEKGDTGEKGADGTSVRTGNGAPSSELGIDGDSYIDLSTWDYYTKASGEWTKKGNIHNEKETYTVSFDTDGGEAIEPITVEKGSRIDGIQAKKSGCYLQYWELNGDRWNPIKDTVNCNITLKAVWGTGTASHSGNTLTSYSVAGVTHSSITTPTMVEGYQITEIGRNCFMHAFKYDSITISEGVTTIGEKAFYSAISVEEVNFPSTLKRIKNSAFEATEKLDHFDFSNTKLEDIGDYAFKGNTLITSLSFPKSLNSIGKSAVEGCTALTSVSFAGGILGPDKNDNTLVVGEKCFYGCSSLETISLNHEAFSFGQGAFYGIKSGFVLTYPAKTVSSFKKYCPTKAPWKNPDGDGFTDGTIKGLDSALVSTFDD